MKELQLHNQGHIMHIFTLNYVSDHDVEKYQRIFRRQHHCKKLNTIIKVLYLIGT